MTPRLRLFAAAAVVGGLVMAVVSAEVLLRVIEGAPGPAIMDIVIEPGGKYQVADPVLGFRPLPGRYQAMFDHRYRWQFTNLPDTTRITKPEGEYGARPARPGIWIFGCSFVQGWGLDDDDTFAWKLQQEFSDYDVVNFGVGGYGTLQSLLQFRQALRRRPPPEVVVLAYAHFHDERNTRTRAWRDANFAFARFGTTAQPYARFDGKGGLSIRYSDEAVPMLALRHRSALFDLAARGYGGFRDLALRSHEVSTLLIEQFLAESRRAGSTFLLAGISASRVTRAMLRRFAADGVETADISVDLQNHLNRIPYDGHPSAVANTRYAEAIGSALRDGVFE